MFSSIEQSSETRPLEESETSMIEVWPLFIVLQSQSFSIWVLNQNEEIGNVKYAAEEKIFTHSISLA